MKPIRIVSRAALVVVVLGAIVGWVLLKQRTERSGGAKALPRADLAEASDRASQPDIGVLDPWQSRLAEQTTAPPDTRPPATPGAVAPAGRARGAPATVPAVPVPRPSGKAPALDPLARVALSFVGAEPEAEAYWYAAINDPGLPAEERQDLIEDLNEDGLSDPHRPKLEDLPLIMSRILLIEGVAPYAMDQVNADAFAEAYKDLVGLLNPQPPP